MKKFSTLASSMLLAMGLLTISCNNEETIICNANEEDVIYNADETKLSSADIQSLVSALRPQTRAANTEDFVYITDEEYGDTLLYVVNYPEGGWTMYSSDKRVPAIVAESKNGCFVLEDAEENYGEWLEATCEDMKAVRESDNKGLNFSAEEISANSELWDAVSNPDAFVKTHIDPNNEHSTRASSGHYRLVKVDSVLVFGEQILHLTTTRWDQNHPYNLYCPMTNDGSGLRAPAGCVAIAGAQMLYYLHHKFGVIDSIPTKASCSAVVGDYYNSNNMKQWDYRSEIWEELKEDGNNEKEGKMMAPLIAQIGLNIGMKYGNDGSSVAAKDLIPYVFNPRGIACDYDVYSSTIAMAEIKNKMPVIVRAYGRKKKKIIRTKYYDGHAFIIDGMRNFKYKYRFTFKWIGEVSDSTKNDTVIVNYGTPFNNQIRINWGLSYWHGRYNGLNNDIWFSATDTWPVTIDGKELKYNYKREMIYNFRPKVK